ncbi:hypothetical protein [Pseudonocardia lacus]|uniref:hypothetical protein n=1 Tax=Pseudonocardia lacus TaxID=2835865 RepID=UPI001BDCDCFF|nr:hypothetical protein [Pseudonocardia lacus]
MVDVIWATLGVAGWMVGVLVLLTMALFPLLEAVEAHRDRRAGRPIGADRPAPAGAGR